MTITGTSASETLTGTTAGETILGLAGDDTLIGNGGSDFLDGGLGTDTLRAGDQGTLFGLYSGRDAIFGGAGIDTVMFGDSYRSFDRAVIVDLDAGKWFDGLGESPFVGIENVFLPYRNGHVAFGSSAANTIYGGSYGDRLQGAGGDDSLYGNEGDDLLAGGPGRDILAGQDGIDTASYADATAAIRIDLTSGVGQIGGVTYNAFDGADLDLLSGIEIIIGSRFDDVFTGGVAAITIDGGDGTDVINGGGGPATVSYASASRAVIIDLNVDRGWDGVSLDRFTAIGRATGSAFDDRLFGSETEDDTLDGGSGGADTLSGGVGVDTLSFAASARGVILDIGVGAAFDGVSLDSFSGFEAYVGSGFNDTIFGSEAADVINGYSGSDVIYGFGGDDTLYALDDGIPDIDRFGTTVLVGGAGADTYFGGNRDSIVSYLDSDFAVVANTATGIGRQGPWQESLFSIDALRGSRFDDELAASSHVDGGAGGSDRLIALNELTMLRYLTSERAVDIDLEAGTSFDGVSTDTLIGFAQNGQPRPFTRVSDSPFDDVVRGTALSDTFHPLRGGADVFDARGGIDTLSPLNPTAIYFIDLSVGLTWDGFAQDRISDFENVSSGNATATGIFGNDVANVLTGGRGNDTIIGSGGDDRLIGRSGADFLEGGNGADVFVGTFPGEMNGDTIRDFEGGGDRLELREYGAGSSIVRVGQSDVFTLTSGRTGAAETLTIQGNFDPSRDVVFVG